jgi:hypothetical protein
LSNRRGEEEKRRRGEEYKRGSLKIEGSKV